MTDIQTALTTFKASFNTDTTVNPSKQATNNINAINVFLDSLIGNSADRQTAQDILEHEKVEVLNLNNGHRLETYAIRGKAGSGVICLNGPAARGACVGDQVVILTYVLADTKESKAIKPKIIKVDGKNRVKN